MVRKDRSASHNYREIYATNHALYAASRSFDERPTMKDTKGLNGSIYLLEALHVHSSPE